MKQANTYFAHEAPSGSSKIYELEFNYFQALSYKNSNNLVKMRDAYSKLAKENNNLFFVKEAKQELERIQNVE